MASQPRRRGEGVRTGRGWQHVLCPYVSTSPRGANDTAARMALGHVQRNARLAEAVAVWDAVPLRTGCPVTAGGAPLVASGEGGQLAGLQAGVPEPGLFLGSGDSGMGCSASPRKYLPCCSRSTIE